MTTDLLWTEASRDVEAERAQLRLFEAQQRCADLWPFMALARSQAELDHRLALVRDTLDARIPDPVMQEALIEGFTANFKIGYADDLNSDTGEGEEPTTSSSGFAGGGSSLQDQDGTPDITASLHQPMQIWHAAKRAWITVTADTPPNPAYFSGGPEEGPNTAQTGSYPVEVAGPDPWNPINGKLPLPPTNVIPPANRFPAQPQPWSVPADASWVDNPMRFDSGPHAHQGSVGEGLSGAQQSNPNYFGQGQVGLQSEEGAGFPVNEALPEPDERVDMYGNAPSGAGHGNPGYPGEFAGPAVNMTIPPQYVTGAAQGHPEWMKDHLPEPKSSHPQWMNMECTGGLGCDADIHKPDCPYSPHEGDRLAARSNVAACATCGHPAYREGKKWHHLDAHLKGDHNVMLDADHPWVQQMAHSSAMQREANQYIKKDGDQWVITQKGTGKILSHHDSEEKANEAFSAMEWHKHSGSRQSFVDLARTADLGDMGASPSTTPMQDTSPPVPPSMTQGAPGAEAMPSPGAGSQNTPTPSVGAGGASSIPTTGTLNPRVAHFFHVGEDMVRSRPSSQNPNGVPDEYSANTWNGPLETHPRQDAGQRGANTPQAPSSPIPQISSSDNPGANERSAQQDEEEDDD